LSVTRSAPLLLALVLVTAGWSPYLWHFSDLAIGDFDEYAAVAEAVRKCVLQYHQFPFWNPWHFGGTPLFARPLTATFALDTVLPLVFGTLGGLKLAMLGYALIGTVGMWCLLRHMGSTPLSRFHSSALFGLQGALMIHVAAGHLVMAVVVFAPWAVLCLLRLQSDRYRWGIALGGVLALILHHSVHYVSVMVAVTLLALYAGQARVHLGTRSFRINSALAVLTAATLSAYRVIVTLDLLRDYPRTMEQRVAIAPADLLVALVAPGQSLQSWHPVGPGLGWWEIGSYVGAVAVALVAVSAWGRWRWFHWGVLLTAVLALNSSCRWLPGYWLREVPPFTSMMVVTRWRLLLVFCLAVAAAHGLDRLLDRWRARGRLALLVAIGVSVGALLGNAWSTWRDVQWVPGASLAVPVAVATDTIITVDRPLEQADLPPTVGSRRQRYSEWASVHRNLGMLFAYEQLLGYPDEQETYSSRRLPYGARGYRGEVAALGGSLRAVSWSPSSIEITAGDRDATVWINQNPSSYWRATGQGRLFPDARVFETLEPFVVPVPARTTVSVEARPPLHDAALAATGIGLVGLLLASIYLRRSAP
jgi:hypothetical protein